MFEVVVGRDKTDIARFGKRGTINIGKFITGIGDDAHLTTDVFMDVLRPHVILICGKRGQGKSYSMGIIVEEIARLDEKIRNRLSVLMIDTQGVFWTMKYPNEKEERLLEEWNLKANGIKIYTYIPYGQVEIFRKAGIEFDGVFSISPAELTLEEWIGLLNININDPKSMILRRVLSMLEGEYKLNEIIEKVQKIEGFEREKLVLENLLAGTMFFGVFGDSNMPKILEPGKITIMDVSLTPQAIRELLVSLICKRIFFERVKARREEEFEGISEIPLCWIFIDEAHNFVPSEKKAISSDILLKLVREGRQPGISTVFATQQPFKIHQGVLSQCDLVISHRLTARDDIKALSAVMQTYMLYEIDKYINELPRKKGVSVILDDNSERLYKVQIRPRISWHGGESALALKKF